MRMAFFFVLFTSFFMHANSLAATDINNDTDFFAFIDISEVSATSNQLDISALQVTNLVEDLPKKEAVKKVIKRRHLLDDSLNSNNRLFIVQFNFESLDAVAKNFCVKSAMIALNDHGYILRVYFKKDDPLMVRQCRVLKR